MQRRAPPEDCVEGYCDVTFGQGELFLFFFFFYFRLWQNGNLPSADLFLVRLPPSPLSLPMQRSVSHSLSLSHTHTPRLLCLRGIEQVAKKYSAHFLNEDFIQCLKDYHVPIHPPTASLRLSCSSSGARFIRLKQTVLLFG